MCDELGCGLHRQPRLSDPSRTRERQQPYVIAAQELEDFGELARAPEEGGRLRRQVPGAGPAAPLQHID